MLAQARTRATDFGDHSFDTVVCTFSLCAIPDERLAVTEMIRVLAPGGTLLLADHVAGTARLTRVVQRLLELVTIPLGEEHGAGRPRRRSGGRWHRGRLGMPRLARIYAYTTPCGSSR